MGSKKIKKVLVLGSGTMGTQIGLLCAVAGFDVTIYDILEDSLKQSKQKIQKLAKSVVVQELINQKDADAGLLRIIFTIDPEKAGKDADLISESIPEDPVLKQKVFSQFNKICPKHTIFTTNTSTLVPSIIAEATGRPEKFLALHFHDYSITNVVDVMPHPGTSVGTLETVMAFCKDIDQYPIELKKEKSGYVFNTMLSELFQSALSLISRDVASHEDIDRVWMGIMKTFMGPFGLMDSVGIETVHTIADYWAKKTNDPKLKANAAYLKKFVDKGDIGIKTGKGFYEYPDPSFLKPDFLKGIR
ncbi:MAG: 3-hydroxybutyryl-CoA dehydrogenase [Desulfobacteraceae bacterium 4572_19]|nr:MAG: 3-hydroxybutyryl-CoA dehydrogenase [Desulfobacteraceae bacterium 4572_19]